MSLRSALGRPDGSRRSDLAHARGLGATGKGTEHWYWERLTALAMVPLVVWFAVSLLSGVAADTASMAEWLGRPGNLTLMILMIVFFFWHTQIAFGVVIADYVHHEAPKIGMMIAVKLGCIVFGIFAAVAAIVVGLGG